MKQSMLIAWLSIGLMGAYAPPAPAQGVYKSQIRVYRVLTNISGNSSQTLECSTGDIVHEIAEHLDAVDLKMKGDSLLWNDAEVPNYPFIVPLSTLHIALPREAATGSIASTSAAEYFELKDGNWIFATTKSEPGLRMDFHLIPVKDRENVIENDYSFEFSYIKERLPLPGVTTLDVGKPVIESIVSKGKWQSRLGEWSCLRLSVPSKGRLYIFVRTLATDDKSATPAKP